MKNSECQKALNDYKKRAHPNVDEINAWFDGWVSAVIVIEDAVEKLTARIGDV